MSTSHKPPDRAAESAGFMDRFEETAFKWGGLVMIFLAVAFAMGIAIENGLFTPPLRVAGGILVGAGLIGVGLFTYVGRPIFGQSLQGAGLAVIFLSIFAGHQQFNVISWEAAMGGTVVVTALSYWLAARRGDSALAAIGLLGGVVAPFVLSLGDGVGGGPSGSTDSYVIYATTLLLAAIAVYYFNGWGTLLVTSGALSLATFAGILLQLERNDSQLLAQTGITVVALSLWLVPLVRVLLQRPVQVSRHSLDRVWSDFFRGAELSTVVWAPAAAVAATVRIWGLDPTQSGLVTLSAAVVVGAIGFIVRRQVQTLGLTHFIAASSLLAIATALLLEGPALMVGFAGQAFAYLVIGRRTESPVLTTVGAVLAIPVSLLLVFEMTTVFETGTGADVAQLVAHLIVIVFIGAGAALEREAGIRNYIAGAAYLLLAVWLAEAFVGVRNGAALTTATWILMAAGAAYVGLRFASKPGVQTGLATVLIAVAKLLTVDLIHINAVGRAISFFVAGVVLVAFGYKYPAMREVINGDDPTPEERRFIYADPPPYS